MEKIVNKATYLKEKPVRRVRSLVLAALMVMAFPPTKTHAESHAPEFTEKIETSEVRFIDTFIYYELYSQKDAGRHVRIFDQHLKESEECLSDLGTAEDGNNIFNMFIGAEYIENMLNHLNKGEGLFTAHCPGRN